MGIWGVNWWTAELSRVHIICFLFQFYQMCCWSEHSISQSNQSRDQTSRLHLSVWVGSLSKLTLERWSNFPLHLSYIVTSRLILTASLALYPPRLCISQKFQLIFFLLNKYVYYPRPDRTITRFRRVLHTQEALKKYVIADCSNWPPKMMDGSVNVAHILHFVTVRTTLYSAGELVHKYLYNCYLCILTIG